MRWPDSEVESRTPVRFVVAAEAKAAGGERLDICFKAEQPVLSKLFNTCFGDA